MTSRRLVSMAAAAAVVGVTGAEAMPSWTGQRPVADALAVAPDVAVNAAGRAIAVWDEETGPDCATAPASLTCVHTLVIRDKPSAGAPWGATAPVARPGVD